MSRENKFSEDAPRTERMSPNSPDHGWWGRENIDLPYHKVWRQLRSSVGEPWDNVWSKICFEYKTGYVANEIRSYVRYQVHENVKFEKGKPYRSDGGPLYRDFFVDGKGILCYYEEPRYKEKPSFVGYLINLENKYYCKYEDIWYECEFPGLYFDGDRWPIRQFYPRHNEIDQYYHFYIRIKTTDSGWAGSTFACTNKRQVDSKMAKRLDSLAKSE